MSDQLDTAWHYYHLGCMSRALEIARGLLDKGDEDAGARLIITRCLLTLGRYKEVIELKDASSDRYFSRPSNVVEWELCLFSSFSKVFTDCDTYFVIDLCKAALEWSESEPSNIRLSSVARLLLGKALFISVKYKQVPYGIEEDARRFFDEAAVGFMNLGSTCESMQALVDLAYTHSLDSVQGIDSARQVLNRALKVVSKCDNLARHGDVTLLRAIIDCEDAAIRRITDRKALEEFDNAIAIYS